jgi:hypothetical protein
MMNSRTLRKIHVYFKAKQGMGKLKRLLNLTENGNEMKACKAELDQMLDTFRVSRVPWFRSKT